MKTKYFDSVKNQTGCCGIWCGSCVAGNGVLNELTNKYENIINAYGLENWAPRDFDFKEFVKGLCSIQGMPLCSGCLKNGGRDDCEIKICVMNKKIADCSECDAPEKCSNTDTLEKMRAGAKEAGLFVKIKNIDSRKLIAEWTNQLKSEWPSIILFMNDKS